MWCKQCERETNNDKCDICNTATETDIPLVIYWCSTCNVPIIKYKYKLAVKYRRVKHEKDS